MRSSPLLVMLALASCGGGKLDRDGSATLTGIGGAGTAGIRAGGAGGGGGGGGAGGGGGTCECDGANLGGKSCATLGYATGTLACAPDCTLDATGCSECVAPGGRIASCGDPGLNVEPAGLAIAATDRDVALAWSERDPSTGLSLLGFARLSSTLELAVTTRIEEPMLADSGDYRRVDVSPLPSGWVVAGSSTYEIFIRAFSATGVPLGRTTVATGVSIAVYLVARPGGGPLVAWDTAANDNSGDRILNVAMVADDGLSISTPRAVRIEGYWGLQSLVYAGGAFQAATVVYSDTNGNQLRLRRIETDGTPSTVVDALPDVRIFSPVLVADAGDLRVLSQGPFPDNPDAFGVFLHRFDALGAALGDPELLDGTSREPFFSPAMSLAMGDDTVALMTAPESNTLAVTRLGGDGLTVTPTFTIAAWPLGYGFSLVMARRGPELVVAWAPGPHGLRLARVTP